MILVMRYCKKCLMPDTRPGLEFDDNGVCFACVHYEKRKIQIGMKHGVWHHKFKVGEGLIK